MKRLLFAAIAWLACTAPGWAQAPAVPPLKAAERLGYELFFDAGVLSIDGTMSCASCHIPDPKFGYSDGRKIAVGRINSSGARLGLLGVRNTRTLLNVTDFEDGLQDADGRLRGLMQSCVQAVTDPLVLGHNSLDDMAARAAQRSRYQELAKLAYGTPGVTDARLRSSLVYFLRKLRSENLPADRLAAGLDSGLPESAVRGWRVFQQHCTVCHSPDNGWRDHDFHNIGISARSASSDALRGAVTGNAADNFKAATPTLVEIAKTRPYMHDGSLSSLEDVVGFFAYGGAFQRNGQVLRDPTIDSLVARIRYSRAEAADLKDFLELGFQGEQYPYFENPHPSKKVAGAR